MFLSIAPESSCIAEPEPPLHKVAPPFLVQEGCCAPSLQALSLYSFGLGASPGDARCLLLGSLLAGPGGPSGVLGIEHVLASGKASTLPLY